MSEVNYKNMGFILIMITMLGILFAYVTYFLIFEPNSIYTVIANSNEEEEEEYPLLFLFFPWI